MIHHDGRLSQRERDPVSVHVEDASSMVGLRIPVDTKDAAALKSKCDRQLAPRVDHSFVPALKDDGPEGLPVLAVRRCCVDGNSQLQAPDGSYTAGL